MKTNVKSSCSIKFAWKKSLIENNLRRLITIGLLPKDSGIRCGMYKNEYQILLGQFGVLFNESATKQNLIR